MCEHIFEWTCAFVSTNCLRQEGQSVLFSILKYKSLLKMFSLSFFLSLALSVSVSHHPYRKEIYFQICPLGFETYCRTCCMSYPHAVSAYPGLFSLVTCKDLGSFPSCVACGTGGFSCPFAGLLLKNDQVVLSFLQFGFTFTHRTLWITVKHLLSSFAWVSLGHLVELECLGQGIMLFIGIQLAQESEEHASSCTYLVTRSHGLSFKFWQSERWATGSVTHTILFL